MLPIGRLDGRIDRTGPNQTALRLLHSALCSTARQSLSKKDSAAPFSSARLLAIALSSAAVPYPLLSHATPCSSPHSVPHGVAARPTLPC
jgi:hypothetical protein